MSVNDDGMPAPLVAFVAEMEKLGNEVIEVPSFGLRARIVIRGFDYAPEYSVPVPYVRVLFCFEEQSVGSVLSGLPLILLSFTLDLRKSAAENVSILRDFSARQLSSMLSDHSSGDLPVRATRSARGWPLLAGFGALTSILLAVLVLFRVTWSGGVPILQVVAAGTIALSVSVLVRVVSSGALAPAGRLEASIRMRQGLLDLLSPWKGISRSHMLQRRVQALVEPPSEEPTISAESLTSLIGGMSWPDVPGPQLLYQVGGFLQRAVEILGPHPEKRPLLRAIISQVEARYAEYEHFSRELIVVADNVRLPQWAVECFPALFHEVQRRSDKHFVISWWPLLEYLKTRNCEGHWRILRSLCGGVVFELEVNEPCYKVLLRQVSLFENLRKGFPYASSSALKGMIMDAFAFLENEDRSQGLEVEAARIASLRQQVLGDEGVGYAELKSEIE